MLEIQGLHHVSTMSLFHPCKCASSYYFFFFHPAEWKKGATLLEKKKNPSDKLLHSGFHFPDILDNSWAAGKSGWEADFQPKQIAALTGGIKVGWFLDVENVSEAPRSKLRVTFNIYPRNICFCVHQYPFFLYLFHFNAFLCRGKCATILISVT